MEQLDSFEQQSIELASRLKELASEYELVDRCSAEKVRIRFIGGFKGREIVWDATISTLNEYRKSVSEDFKLRQFIEIALGENNYKLMIGLNIGEIDKAAIKKSIIMIRNYKRLHIGRHEYGDVVDIK
ncbi:MAG: hypothetical protein OQL06_06905 [Gammaproteobacteria bacterium]|nr:hypothetical protein [Gammaproteobacteria bacterium]